MNFKSRFTALVNLSFIECHRVWRHAAVKQDSDGGQDGQYSDDGTDCDDEGSSGDGGDGDGVGGGGGGDYGYIGGNGEDKGW